MRVRKGWGEGVRGAHVPIAVRSESTQFSPLSEVGADGSSFERPGVPRTSAGRATFGPSDADGKTAGSPSGVTMVRLRFVAFRHRAFRGRLLQGPLQAQRRLPMRARALPLLDRQELNELVFVDRHLRAVSRQL